MGSVDIGLGPDSACHPPQVPRTGDVLAGFVSNMPAAGDTIGKQLTPLLGAFGVRPSQYTHFQDGSSPPLMPKHSRGTIYIDIYFYSYIAI